MNEKIRLYRACSIRDQMNGFVLVSKKIEALSNLETMEEIVSHELDPKKARGIMYSFSTRLDLVKDYREKYSNTTDIMYVDIDLNNRKNIVSIHPTFDRDYLMRKIATSKEILDTGYVKNPATGRKHTVVGIINYSQRTVSGWAYAMREVMMQCNGLRLKHLDDKIVDISSEYTEEKLKKYPLKSIIPQTNIEKLRKIIQNTYENNDLKRKFLLNHVNSDSWYTEHKEAD